MIQTQYKLNYYIEMNKIDSKITKAQKMEEKQRKIEEKQRKIEDRKSVV